MQYDRTPGKPWLPAAIVAAVILLTIVLPMGMDIAALQNANARLRRENDELQEKIRETWRKSLATP